MTLLRLFHTVRYLRPVQIYRRAWLAIYRPRIDARAAAPARQLPGVWSVSCARPPSMVDAQTFCFLNITGSVRSTGDWNDQGRPRLWRYNAHYFDDLNADGAANRVDWHRALIAQWIAENPAAEGTGWEPYPASIRIVNWIKWSLSRDARGENGLDASARHSLAMQVRMLSKLLETHLLGNHLWANAKALVFAGIFFEGKEAAAWLANGAKLIDRELAEQVLPDGGHFERSPMYHGIVLEDVLDLINLAGTAPTLLDPHLVARLKSTVSRMHHWLRVMTHPDGLIALFNDAAFEIAPGSAALAEYASRLGLVVGTAPLAPVEVLPDSGYVRLQNARAVVICDVGLVGPDYLPGHAHADTLSFELSLDGRRLVVNSGTSTYDVGRERQRQRGTAAHNTVQVDQLDSTEVWGGFRVARRARPLNVGCGKDERSSWLEATHDGYRRTRGRVLHKRSWRLEEGVLTVSDQLAGHFHSAVAAIHFHPDVGVRIPQADDGHATLHLPSDGSVTIACSPASRLTAHCSTWHPKFGCTEANVVLRVEFEEPMLSTQVNWGG